MQQVSRLEGACSSDWARQTPLNFVDAATRSRPAEMTVAPGQTIRVEIGAQRVHGTWDCTKLGLALSMRVDDGVVCADAGAWISEAETDT